MYMEEGTRTNLYIQSGAILNVQFREASIHAATSRYHFPQSTIRDIIMSSRQAVFGFLVTVLMNFVQLKYQGKSESPFETRPGTMLVAFVSLLMYCLSYDAQLRFSTINNHNTCASCEFFTQISMVIFGAMTLASISSLLFPQIYSPYLYLASIFYSLCQFPLHQIKRAWNQLQTFVVNKFCHQPNQQAAGRRRRRGDGGLVYVRTPWFPGHAIIDQVDILPRPTV